MEAENWSTEKKEWLTENKRKNRNERMHYKPVHVRGIAVTVIWHIIASYMLYYGLRGPFLEPEWRSKGKDNVEIVYGEAKNMRVDDWLFSCPRIE